MVAQRPARVMVPTEKAAMLRVRNNPRAEISHAAWHRGRRISKRFCDLYALARYGPAAIIRVTKPTGPNT